MNIFSLIYTEALFRPLLNLLIGLTNVIPGHYLGVSVIILTLLVRIALLPLSIKQTRSMQNNQSKMKGLQKDMDKIKKQHKDDKSKQAEETMKLYKQAGVNPASGCLPLLIQLPIFIALYRVFLNGIEADSLPLLYSFVSEPATIQAMFFGIDLHSPSILFGVMAGALQFVQMKWLAPQQPASAGANESAAAMTASMQKNMMYIFPVMMVFISMQIPAALSLYFVVTTMFAIGQQYALKRIMHLEGNAPTV